MQLSQKDVASNLLKREQNGEFPEQRTPIWYTTRSNMLTASEISSCLDCNIYTSKYELLLKKIQQTNLSEPKDDDSVNSAISWGVKFEPVAIEFYEFLKEEKVYPIGLVTHSKYKWLGASPDGLILSGKLLEIKCPFRRMIGNSIPLYYWIQVQIQLEVCDLDQCDYLECKFHQYENEDEYNADVNVDSTLKGKHCLPLDNTIIYWKLLSCSLKTIDRDSKWFNDNVSALEEFYNKVNYYKLVGLDQLKLDMKRGMKMDRYEKTKQPIITNKKRKYQDMSTSSNNLINWKYWVSATNIRNYMVDDPLIDWLEYYYQSIISSDNQNNIDAPIVNNYLVNLFLKQNKPNNFNQYLMKKGVVFENEIVKILQNKFGDNMVTIADYQQAKSNVKYLETIDHISKGTPIIYQGVLHDYGRKIFGMPDLLIRSDWINKIFNKPVLSKNYSKVHYRVFEIKYSMLMLCADGKHLRNSTKDIVYNKGQLYIYNKILGSIQGYTPSKSYIIGKAWSYKKCKNTYSGESFDRPATVDFKETDSFVRTKTAKAIKWIRKMRFKGHKWSVIPSSRNELRPNMCNVDERWSDIKKYISEKTSEITQLWMCGIDNRIIADKNRIKDWRTHSGLTTKHLGVTGDKVTNTLQLIIDYNQDPLVCEPYTPYMELDMKYLIHPKKVKTQLFNWRKSSVEFYVDFETVTDVIMNSDFIGSLIFMIGVGYCENYEWKFKCFIADSLDISSERKIMIDFHNFIAEKSDILNLRNTKNKLHSRLWHWGHAEKSLYNNSICRHINYIPNEKLIYNWCDMLRIFKDEPIVTRGALNFSLKTVVKAFYDNGFIETSYIDSPVNNGLNAMVLAYEEHVNFIIHNQQNNNKLNLADSFIIQQIKNYNEIDCKVLWEILRYLREHH